MEVVPERSAPVYIGGQTVRHRTPVLPGQRPEVADGDSAGRTGLMLHLAKLPSTELPYA